MAVFARFVEERSAEESYPSNVFVWNRSHQAAEVDELTIK